MKQSVLAALAAFMLGITLWLFNIMQQPGTNLFASIGGGSASMITVWLIVAAARADTRERQ